MLITGRVPPVAFEVELRDLRSRLRAAPVVSLMPPDDLLFRGLIVKFCADRQLSIDETVVSYLVTRIERSYAAARQAVELLDTEALRLGRPVTRALAAEVLRQRPDRSPMQLPAALTAAAGGTSMSLKRHRRITCCRPHSR